MFSKEDQDKLRLLPPTNISATSRTRERNDETRTSGHAPNRTYDSFVQSLACLAAVHNVCDEGPDACLIGQIRDRQSDVGHQPRVLPRELEDLPCMGQGA